MAKHIIIKIREVDMNENSLTIDLPKRAYYI